MPKSNKRVKADQNYRTHNGAIVKNVLLIRYGKKKAWVGEVNDKFVFDKNGEPKRFNTF